MRVIIRVCARRFQLQQPKGRMKMDCKKRIYEDGEYVLCSRCLKAEKCEDIKKCAGCGSIKGVFYDQRTDLFLCARCEYEANK